MNAQLVLEVFETHMTTSSKGKAEKHRLYTYVTTTVLDRSWRDTTEQFVLHFNEQFRQLDEVSPSEESLPYTTRLTLLQPAVHKKEHRREWLKLTKEQQEQAEKEKSEEKPRKYFQHVRCYNCNKMGHFTKNCPEKKSRDSSGDLVGDLL